MQAAPRSLPSVAPLRGVFPLDHERACKPRADAFIECIRASAGAAHAECRGLSRAYLECRMAAGLMAKESIADLGLGDAPPAAAPAAPAAPAPPAAPDARECRAASRRAVASPLSTRR